MKILELRFKNLNSLIGEWLIDFTADEYLCDGIFAITGATGAGKTTILDAICLALYGETPRLGKITKSSNEIMSKQCSECFSEICFSTKEGNFRCTWSQHRSRRKADGELQAPKHEISNADTGEILEAKIKDVSNLIISKIGMDFKQFTRSILLAQGGFAAFLNAKAEERAPILEQITGTEIYSTISLKVHERRNEEQKKLDLLSAELASINLLDDETLKQKDLALEQNIKEASLVQKDIESVNKSITVIERSFELKNKLLELEQESENCVERIQSFLLKEAENLYSRITLNQKVYELNEGEIISNKKKFTEVLNYLSKNSQDEKLISEFTAIKESFQRYLRTVNEKDLKNTYINKLELKLSQHRELYGKATIYLKDLLAEKDSTTEQLLQKEQEYIFLLKKTFCQKSNTLSLSLEKINLNKTTEEIQIKLLNSLEEEKILLSKIFSLEAERKNLEDSKPCPLCGSLEHPFAKGNLITEGEIDKKINSCKNELNALRQAILALELEKKGLEKDLEHLKKELRIYTSSSEETEQLTNEIATIPIKEGVRDSNTGTNSFSKLLESLCLDLEKLKSQKNQVLEKIEKENKTLESLKEDGLKIKNELEAEKQFYSKLLTTITEEEHKISTRVNPFLSEELSSRPEDKNTFSEFRISEIISLLENKLKAYETHCKLKVETSLVIEKLEEEQENTKKTISELMSETSQRERPQELAQAMGTPESLSDLKTTLEKLKTEHRNINILKQELEKESYSLTGSINSLKLNLEELIIPQENLEDLILKRNSLTIRNQNILEGIGSIKKELEHNQIAKQEQEEKLSKLKAQKKELERFSKLHILIGSSDGNKYRKFVQGLSFQMVISYANKQLQEMSDRYILCMDKNQALELNVIDNYQAGEIRSTKNLSGGESFIISLALALGLSKIVSSNIRVDSLFLDEGFGTLDVEALEVALETLSSLKQSGKLIGIISHMEALKERIPTQIKVESISGGRSVLSGAGCQKIG